MFELKERTVVLGNFNPRVENCGPDEKKPAADLRIDLSLPNAELGVFHPGLKEALYHFDAQRGGDLVDAAHKDEDPGYAPHLRFPKLGPLAWSLEIIGAKVTIAYGASGRGDIVLPDCKVNAFKFEPQDGGTVQTTFRIQGHPDGKQAGKLYDLQGCEITLTIEPPAVEPELPQTEESDAPQSPSDRAKSFFRETVD